MYLNGRALGKTTVVRALTPDDDRIEGLTLAAGTNVLVFKLVNSGGDSWDAALPFTDSHGQPVSGLRVSPAP